MLEYRSSLTYLLPIDDRAVRRVALQGWHGTHPNIDGRLGRDWSLDAKGIEPESTWISRDSLRPLDDVCTKFCSATFFPDARARINMVANVLRLYERLADVGEVPVRPVFKGGVMMRLVLLEFWRQQPIAARERVISYMAEHKSITLGDFDFEIVPLTRAGHSKRATMRIVHTQFALLLWLKEQMDEQFVHKRDGLLYLAWSAQDAASNLKKRLQAEIDGIEDANHALRGARVERVVLGDQVHDPPPGYVTRDGKRAPAMRRDVMAYDCLGKDGKPSRCTSDARMVLEQMGMTPSRPKPRGSPFYATCKTYIGDNFPERTRKREMNPLFHLTRIKHAFVLYYETTDGQKRCDGLEGEMIDLALGDHGDEIRAFKHDVIGAAQAYFDYQILGVPRDVVTFRSYSPLHLYYDHQQMLHFKNTPPWETPKYEKRVLRYVAFLVLVLFDTHVSGNVSVVTRLNALERLCAYTGSAEQVGHAPLCTRVPLIDGFAKLEHEVMCHDAPSAKRESQKYMKTVHAHLSEFLVCIRMAHKCRAVPAPFKLLDTTTLDYMNRHIFNE